jgi:hypothetical protein
MGLFVNKRYLKIANWAMYCYGLANYPWHVIIKKEQIAVTICPIKS